MSNEIKYVNEAGVRRIATDTRARLTDLTTNVDSAFGFSLDLSDIDTSLSTLQKSISFSLPKEFNTSVYDIFAKVHLSFTAAITGAPPYYVGGIPVTDGAPCRKKCELLVPISNSMYKDDVFMQMYQAFSREVETMYKQTTSYEVHFKQANAQKRFTPAVKFTVSEGVYKLAISVAETTWGLLTHTYGETSSSNSYTATSATTEYSYDVSINNISYEEKIEAIEILVRKKLEATANNE